MADFQYNIQKSSEASIKFRKEANLLFAKLNSDTCMQTLLLYTKSIAYAPENSEELACGFGNRSAVLKYMEKFQECISDIDRVLSITKSDGLKTKLLSRKASCLKSINVPKPELKQKLELKMIPSKATPCISEKLSFKYNEKYGKHYVANQDIKPGEIIAIEEAYTAFPDTNKLYCICSHCLSHTCNGIPCNFCSMTIYCCENCKNQAWLEYHDVECFVIKNISFQEIPKEQYGWVDNLLVFKFGFRFFTKVIKTHGLEDIIKQIKKIGLNHSSNTFSCRNFHSCYNMACKMTDISSEAFNIVFDKYISQSIHLLSQLEHIFTDNVKSIFESKDKMLTFFEQLLKRFILITVLNGISFYESGCLGRSGPIIALCCSLFNHSCFPNASMIFAKKKKVIFFTSQPIKKGEQLCMSYNNTLASIEMTKFERQAYLLKQYNFICDCQACSENWPPVNGPNRRENSPLINQKIEKIMAQYEKTCGEKKMNPILKTSVDWPYNEETLSQVIELSEEYYKNFNRSDVAEQLFCLNTYIIQAFQELYSE